MMQRTKTKIRDTGKVDGSRRYPEGKHPEYHAEYDHRIKRSAILSGTGSAMDRNAFALSGLGNMKSALAELKGGEGGYYTHDTQRLRALIPSIQQELQKIYQQFGLWQKRQIETGASYDLPKHWPPDLLSKRLKAEAALDVYTREKSVLESRIVELQERAKKDHEKGILPFGPIGELGKKGNAIISVDGQRLTFDAKGRPRISEPSSPFDGLSLYHYQEMSKQWVEQHHLKKRHHQEVAEILREFEKNKSKKSLRGEPWAVEIVKKYIEHFDDSGYSELRHTIGRIFKWRKQYDWPSIEKWPEWQKDVEKVG